MFKTFFIFFFKVRVKHYRSMCLSQGCLSLTAKPVTGSREVDREMGSVEAVRTSGEDFTNRNTKLVLLGFAIRNNSFSSF